MSISFNQWQAGRRHVPDLSAEIDDECVGGPGFAYPGQFYINDNPTPALGGKYRLLLEREEYFSDDLGALERQLFEWASPIEGGVS